MNNKTREIFKLFDDASHFISRKGGKINRSIINNLLSNLYSPGPSFQYVFDFSLRDFTYVSPSIKNVLGLEQDELDINKFMELIHPEDLKHFLHSQELGSYFMFSFIKKEQLPHYKLSYQFRLKTENKGYKLFLHQAIASSWEDDFKMSSSFTNHTDISHITTVNNYKVSFINIVGGKSYYGIRAIEDLNSGFFSKKIISDKEFEVLNLIAEGFRSKEIANYLNISDHTVATHRKNILKKTNFGTIPQAITHFIREGLI